MWKEARLLELLVWEGLHEDEEIDDAGLVCRYSLAGWSRCRGLARRGWRGGREGVLYLGSGRRGGGVGCVTKLRGRGFVVARASGWVCVGCRLAKGRGMWSGRGRRGGAKNRRGGSGISGRSG